MSHQRLHGICAVLLWLLVLCPGAHASTQISRDGSTLVLTTTPGEQTWSVFNLGGEGTTLYDYRLHEVQKCESNPALCGSHAELDALSVTLADGADHVFTIGSGYPFGLPTTITGGDGDETITLQAVASEVHSGAGDDFIQSGEPTGGAVDHVFCGSGNDTVLADTHDVVAADCEHRMTQNDIFTATGPNFDLIYPQATTETVIGTLRHYSSGPQFFVNSGGSPISAEASFECRLDGADFEPCSGVTTYTGTSEGRHLLWVRSTYSDNGTPWRVADRVAVFIYDSTPPPAPTMAAPKSPTNSPYLALDIEGDDDLQCVIETPEEFLSCGAYLEDGDYTVHVRLVDLVRNVGPERSFDFTVDTVPPLHPVLNLVNCGSDFCAEFYGTGPPFECSRDGAAYKPCTSPVNLGPSSVFLGTPSVGKHAFRVRVHDASGNAASNIIEYWVHGMTPLSPPSTPPISGAPPAFGPLPNTGPILLPRLTVTARPPRSGGAIRATCRTELFDMKRCKVSALDAKRRVIARGVADAFRGESIVTLQLTKDGARLLQRRGSRGLHVRIKATALSPTTSIAATGNELVLRESRARPRRRP